MIHQQILIAQSITTIPSQSVAFALPTPAYVVTTTAHQAVVNASVKVS